MTKIDEEFWDRFVAEYWRKKPVVFRDVVDAPPLHADEIVAGIAHVAQDAASRANDLRAMEHVRLYIGGRLAQPPEYMLFFPQTTSWEEYCEQVSSRVGDEEFGIVLNFFHLMYPPFWDRIRQFSDPLVRRLGLPASSIETALFCGRYQKTAFGIHKDADADVMSFCPAGVKRFLVWAPDYFDGNPMTRLVVTDPQAHRSSAIELELGPRDMMYIPGNWWHTAFNETPGSSASIAFGFWHRVSLPTLVSAMLRDYLEERLGEQSRFVGCWPSSGELPREIKDLIAMFESEKLEEALRERWQARVSDAGYGRGSSYI